jgi:hypothetical protein
LEFVKTTPVVVWSVGLVVHDIRIFYLQGILLAALKIMSHNSHLNNPQITVSGFPDDSSTSSSLVFPFQSLDASRSDSERRTWRRAWRAARSRHSSSPLSTMDNHGHPSSTPILRSARDVFGGSPHTSDLSHLHHPSPTHSGSSSGPIQVMCSRDQEPWKGNTSERDAKYNLLSPPRSAPSNVISALPSPGQPTLTWKPLQIKLQTQSRSSAVTSLFRRTVGCVRRSSSSPSSETDSTGSDPTRNDEQRGDNKKQRSAVLDNLEERSKAANKLHEEAVDGTVVIRPI